MRIKRFYKTRSFTNMLILMLTLLFLAVTMEAMAWQRNVSRSGTGGRNTSRNITANRTGNGYTRNTTATGPQGNTTTRSAQGQWDSGTNTWTKSITTTGPNGQSATSNTTATKTDGGYNKTTTATGPQGNTATRSAQGQWDPETNTWTKSISTTGANK